jgi:hypothetical protein
MKWQAEKQRREAKKERLKAEKERQQHSNEQLNLILGEFKRELISEMRDGFAAAKSERDKGFAAAKDDHMTILKRMNGGFTAATEDRKRIRQNIDVVHEEVTKLGKLASSTAAIPLLSLV